MSGDDPLLRRLAVHAWRLRDDRTVDDKLRWVCEKQLLYDLDAQHEVFLLLRTAVPTASSDAIDGLLRAVDAGPAPAGGEAASPYRRYNVLSWLNTVAPGVSPIAAAFAQVQATHPEFAPREYPDLSIVMSAGFVEDAEPFPTDVLHAKIEHDPEAALNEIRSFQTIGEFTLTGPTWHGALKSVQNCVTRFPADGLVLAGIFTDGDAALRGALIEGWAAAHLDDHQIESVIATVDSWDPAESRGQASRMLANGDQDGRPTAWHRFPSARALATKLWPHEEVEGNVLAGDDPVLEALNHPAGDLALFWTRVVQLEWRQHQDTWTRLPSELADQLDRMVRADNRNGQLARVTLTSYLHFYFAADADWTRTRLLPLLDWDRQPNDASAAWQGFLGHGRPDDGLLGAGLLDLYLQCCQHAAQLRGRRYQTQLADHLALVAMFTSPSPATWLPTFVQTAPDDLREAWAARIASRLIDLSSDETSSQWNRWIHAYWTSRINSLPRPLTAAEASTMARWVLSLPTERAAAVHLVQQSPAGLPPGELFLHRLAEQDLTTDAPTWTDFLTHLLRGTPEPSWDLSHYLPQLVRELKNADPPPDLEPLINQAMRLGCTEAPDW